MSTIYYISVLILKSLGSCLALCVLFDAEIKDFVMMNSIFMLHCSRRTSEIWKNEVEDLVLFFTSNEALYLDSCLQWILQRRRRKV